MKAKNSAKLGVNIDHVATLRQARGTVYPRPVEAAELAIQAGADQITIHLREDRRHIQDRDVEELLEVCTVPVNLEMAATDEMLSIALALKPERVTLVPEKRRELTTEGGLNLAKNFRVLKKAVADLQTRNISVSLFIDPDQEQIDRALDSEAQAIELHTGAYADADDPLKRAAERERLLMAARYGSKTGLFIAAGHGLNVNNVADIATIQEIREFNIGHSIIARAVMVGLPAAVKEMKKAISIL